MATDKTNNEGTKPPSSRGTLLATAALVHHDDVTPKIPSLSNPSISSSPSSSKKSPEGAVVPLPTRMVLSALSGMVAATFCHPLDVVRVQMQTSATFRNSYHAASTIYNTSGLSGLYAGISAAYLRQWMYGSFRMGIYSFLLERARIQNAQQGRDKSDITFATKLSMGCISGAVGSFVGTPSELALVRMGADSKLPMAEWRNYTSVVNCLVRITREEGLLQLWRGATPTVARATVLSACQMGVTSEAKEWLSNSGWFGENGQLLGGYPMMFCATTISSFCANAVANPFDVMKSRLQNMKIVAGGTPQYTGMVDCFVKSVRAEGPMVLWSGFVPAFLKLAPYTIISLTVADKLTKAWTGKDAL